MTTSAPMRAMLLIWDGARLVGVPPRVMGIGPVYAIPMALKNAGLDIADVDLFEVYQTRRNDRQVPTLTLIFCRSTRRLRLNAFIVFNNSDSISTKSTSTGVRFRLDIHWISLFLVRDAII